MQDSVLEFQENVQAFILNSLKKIRLEDPFPVGEFTGQSPINPVVLQGLFPVQMQELISNKSSLFPVVCLNGYAVKGRKTCLERMTKI